MSQHPIKGSRNTGNSKGSSPSGRKGSMTKKPALSKAGKSKPRKTMKKGK